MRGVGNPHCLSQPNTTSPYSLVPTDAQPDWFKQALDFSFIDAFAGTSSFSENAAPRGASPLAFLESDVDDQNPPLRRGG